MRTQLGVGDYPKRGKWDDYYRDLTQRIDALGILVMRQGNLGHTHALCELRSFAGLPLWMTTHLLFSRAVVSEALSGQLMLREASALLGGVKPNKIERFAQFLCPN